MTERTVVQQGTANRSELLHAPFIPADVRAGEPVRAEVRVKNSTRAPIDMRVWRISPFGVELLLPPDNSLHQGDEIDLTLRLGHQASEFTGLVVTTTAAENGRSLVGVRWYAREDTSAPPDADRRASARWICGVEFLPTGVAANPVRFSDFIHFRVRDISSSGLQIVTSLRNKFLVPGMVLDTMISCPATGQVKVELKLVHARIVSENGKDFLALGVAMIRPTPQTLQTFGQYVLQFGGAASLEELRKGGLTVQSSARAVEFGYVRTPEEYKAVLALRLRAYGEAGKLDQAGPPDAMADIFDSRARILVGRYRGEVVASLRLIYHEPDDPTEHEQYTSFPESFPRKDEMVEITRVCTHPDYRRGDLLLGLFRHTILTVLQSRRRWILGSSTEKLLPIYTRIGCKPTDVRFRHEAVGGEEHVMFLGDCYAGLAGKGMSPVVWNILFNDMLEHIDVRDILGDNPLTAARLGIYRALAPVARLIYARMMRPKKRKTKPAPK